MKEERERGQGQEVSGKHALFLLQKEGKRKLGNNRWAWRQKIDVMPPVRGSFASVQKTMHVKGKEGGNRAGMTRISPIKR